MRLWSVVLGLALLSMACATGNIDKQRIDRATLEGGAPEDADIGTVQVSVSPGTPGSFDRADGGFGALDWAGLNAGAATEAQSQAFALNPPAWRARPEVLPFAGATLPEIEALAAIVVDEASGAVLWEHNAHEALPPASLTKIATAVVTLEKGGLERVVTVDVDSREMPGSSVMGLRPGDEFTLQDLLFGLMLPSGNDAALAVGRAVSGSDEAFVDEMNALVARLGLTSSNYTNPHGLTAQGHVSSAFDLAMLSRYAMSLEGFLPLAETREWTAVGSRSLPMGNLNALLRNYAGADGIKVGFTNRAGRTLVASASRGDNRVYVVLLNAPNSQADAAKLLDWAFQWHRWESLSVGPTIAGLARDVAHVAATGTEFVDQ